MEAPAARVPHWPQQSPRRRFERKLDELRRLDHDLIECGFRHDLAVIAEIEGKKRLEETKKRLEETKERQNEIKKSRTAADAEFAAALNDWREESD